MMTFDTGDMLLELQLRGRLLVSGVLSFREPVDGGAGGRGERGT
jgi:hypothetical protein